MGILRTSPPVGPQRLFFSLSHPITFLDRRCHSGDGVQSEVLARHCAEAGLVEKGVGYWLEAGRPAVARGAMTEAVAQLRKGLDLLSSGLDRLARHELELELQITLAQALMAAKGLAALEPGEVLALVRARHLCEQVGRQQQLGRVLLGQFQNRIARAELEQTERLADEILLLGDSRNDTMWKFFGSVSAGVTCGVFIKARAHLRTVSLFGTPYIEISRGRPMIYICTLWYFFRGCYFSSCCSTITKDQDL